jgi:hypothetical protein
MNKSIFKALQIISLVAGLALFAYLLREVGLESLAEYLGAMGWGFALIVALSFLRNSARAASWYFSIEPSHRHIGYWSLMNVMLAGEAIKYLTATGPLLGEPAKAAMVRRDVPLVQGFSSIVIENLIYNLTVFLFMLAGIPALVWLVDVPDKFELGAYIFAALVILSVLFTWLAIRGRWYILARMLDQAARLLGRTNGQGAQGRRSRLASITGRVRTVEENISRFYEQRRAAFFLIFAVNASAHLINVIEVYIILAMMGERASLSGAFVIEAATKVINAAFFFVPTRAGVYESGNALVLKSLGMEVGAGIALAIIRKLRAFVWIGYGLAVIALLTLKDRRSDEFGALDEAQRERGS